MIRAWLFPLFCLSLAAGPLDEVRGALTAVQGREGVASGSVQHWSRTAKGKDATEMAGSSRFTAELKGSRLVLSWDQGEVEGAQAQEAPGNRLALASLGADTTHRGLRPVPWLLRLLQRAELKEVRNEAWEGRPARLLVLEIRDPKGQPREGEAWHHLRLWVGVDGLPLALNEEQGTRLKMMMVNLDNTQKTQVRFQAKPGRLWMARLEEQMETHAMGTESLNRTVVTF